MAHLVELDLELVDLAQDVAETGDFGVGGGNCPCSSAGGLCHGGDLGLGGKLVKGRRKGEGGMISFVVFFISMICLLWFGGVIGGSVSGGYWLKGKAGEFRDGNVLGGAGCEKNSERMKLFIKELVYPA